MPQDIIHDPLSTLIDLLAAGQRVLIIGASGCGKSTLIARALDALGARVPCISADPGRPTLGHPGALWVGERVEGAWRATACQAVATLDPLRHRLAILIAAARLVREAGAWEGALVVDTPGVLRGGASELHRGLAEVCGVDQVWIMEADEATRAVCAGWFVGLPVEVSCALPHPEAHALSNGQRHEARRGAWKAAMTGHERAIWSRRGVALLGTPPADLTDHVFAAHSGAGELLGMGWVTRVSGDVLEVCWRRERDGAPAALTVRDTVWTSEQLTTRQTKEGAPAVPALPARTMAFMLRERPEIPFGLDGPIKSGGALRLMLPGGVFEDPMAVVRFEHQPRAFFFDLGSVERVPSKIIHQTDDIFMSHAHLDHIGGLVYLLRKSMGRTQPYRVFGPPAIADRFAHMLHGLTWDRIEEGGPSFEVAELHGERLIWRRVCVQSEVPQFLREQAAPGGLLLDEPRLRVRAVALDHVTTSLAFAVEEPCAFDVRGNILRERGWRAGDWLGRLKQAIAARQPEAPITITTAEGGEEVMGAGALGELLLIAKPGQKIVYATDFGDTPENRAAIVALAHKADAMVCESSFAQADHEQAERTLHLTTTACAQIAKEADVGLLIPFHPSIRNEEQPEVIWREIRAIFERTHTPPAIEALLASGARI